ncbi:lactate 2-monooxygenase [Cellulomonas humilata]|uniref:L-lactate dehydrogenase (Cytochrome)/lactate 2-monooxygenase n=1 Tax=Cellulomonas humilata TaxID=144055 RepID=A0ABU0E9H2_9CELL|nr:lactate 2-monooxygenase [Cellulomonas humilata]MDQ0371893.1 L-lactate dehydrogenase (cytochrome)/lactate 2-monooxygenase [Cellulomonas humilata]
MSDDADRRTAAAVGRAVQSRIYRAGVFGRRPVVPVEPEALETAARARMSDVAWAYVAGGAGRQRTVQANRDAFDRHRIVPRMLVDVEQRDTSVELFGRRLPAPLLFAPIGVLELAHRDADHAVARAARALDLPMVISSQASVPMEAVARTLGDAPRWFQLYWSKDDDVVDSFVSRAEDIGSDALVVTLDTHVLGWRTRDLDLAYLPFARGEGIAQYTSDPAFRRLVEARAATRAPADEPAPRPTPAAVRALHSMASHYPGRTRDNLRSPLPRAAVETFLDVFSRSSLTWADLARLRERTSLPIVLKGIQHPGDAALALEHGVDGIVVSNHGGRQVDGAIGSLDALPTVVEVVGGRIPVLFDSGIRSGADVVTALALGATAVLVGRPWVYGLALAGAEGARAVMQHLWAELDLTMALSGVRCVDEIGRDLLAPA